MTRHPHQREEGVALILAMTMVALLAVFLAELHEITSTAYVAAQAERDRVKAEYLSKSGVQLTRLLVMQEPMIRALIAPLYQAALGRNLGQLNIWSFADMVLMPFGNSQESKAISKSAGVDLGLAKGLEDPGGSFEIVAYAENSKINLNYPSRFSGDAARRNVALQLYSLLGGHISPNPYDGLFNGRDPDGLLTTRGDVISAVIDWWDPDQERLVFDPSTAQVTQSGGEDDIYGSFKDPYKVKNAPFDSLAELRLVRGMGDEMWATFIDPDPEDGRKRLVTIYGAGSVNPNEARAEVLLATLCSLIPETSLCADQIESSKFVQLINTARSLLPVPWFSNGGDFLNFVQGKGGPKDLYPTLKSFLGDNNPLMFRPVVIADKLQNTLADSFSTQANILSIECEAKVNRTRVKTRAVVNFHDRWSPPPPNAGGLPPLGVVHYWRID